jgi:GNAT superfamily N-acetyltransferase
LQVLCALCGEKDLMLDTWKAMEITAKDRILAYLETDRLYAAYAIGDLEPGLFDQSTWAIAERGGQLHALALHFRGLKLPALFLMGDVEGVRVILESALRPGPAYLSCRREHLPIVDDFYVWNEPLAMWRMVLKPERFQAVPGDCMRLTLDHSDQLTELYTHGGGGGFSVAQVEHGIFHGLCVDSQLVAVAGTHLVSASYSVAAVGNVFTHPDYRGQGYATVTTSAVVSELVNCGIRDIILNVGQSNAAAIHIYEKLGFDHHCAFFEGHACLQATWRSRQ